VWGKQKRVKNFSQKFEGKRLLGRARHKWEDNIKTDLKGLGCELDTYGTM
jgi:hypothetical protein